MSVLRSLESKLAGLVEGTFSRAFKSEVRPVEIARKLAKEMDDHKVQSLSRVYAPNDYAVWLSAEDRQQFEGTEEELARELSGYLLEHARREKITLGTSPRVVFKTDEKLRLGEFGIQARRVTAPQAEHEAPSQADEGRTMVYSTADRVQEPLREPDPPLFGRSPFEMAEVEMWIRRAEFRLWTPMGQVWINDDERTARVNPNQFKEYGAHMRRAVGGAMKWLNKELSGGGQFLVGDYYSMADIVLLCGLDFAKFVKMEIPEALTHLRAWHERVSARPSARAEGVAAAA